MSRVEFATRLAPDTVCSRLKSSLARVAPLGESSYGPTILIGSLDGLSVRLKVAGRNVQWFAPTFRGEIEQVDARTRLVGVIGYEAPVVAMFTLVGAPFLLFLGTGVWTAFHSAAALAAATGIVGGFVALGACLPQADLFRQLRRAINDALAFEAGETPTV